MNSVSALGREMSERLEIDDWLCGVDRAPLLLEACVRSRGTPEISERLEDDDPLSGVLYCSVNSSLDVVFELTTLSEASVLTLVFLVGVAHCKVSRWCGD